MKGRQSDWNRFMNAWNWDNVLLCRALCTVMDTLDFCLQRWTIYIYIFFQPVKWRYEVSKLSPDKKPQQKQWWGLRLEQINIYHSKRETTGVVCGTCASFIIMWAKTWRKPTMASHSLLWASDCWLPVQGPWWGGRGNLRCYYTVVNKPL